MRAELTERLKREMAAEEARTSVPEGFPALPPIPAERYVDPEYFALEHEHIWSRSWVLAAHQSEIREPGQFVLAEDTGSPIVVVRGRDGVVRAFYNACQHRGAAVVQEPCGQLNAFKCPYHAWVYDLEGHLIARPDEHDFSGDIEGLELASVRCESWGGWIFINRDPAAAPLLETLGDIPAEMDDFRVDELRQAHKLSMEIACNWKVLLEAFLEVYHLKHIHPNTAGMLLNHSATSISLLPGGHSRMVTRKNEGLESMGFHSPEMPLIEGLGEIPRTTSYSYHFFPNIITPLDVAAFPFLVMWPLDARTTRLDVRWHGVDWGEGPRPDHWDRVFNLFDIVTSEDTANLAWIQKSIESNGFSGARCSYAERRIYRMHEYLDELIGPEKIPTGLRVEPLLSRYVEPWVEG
jgi:phenylpropionate dioxygenase-like ring-hydroxylating dioxygenase large terminal subunit